MSRMSSLHQGYHFFKGHSIVRNPSKNEKAESPPRRNNITKIRRTIQWSPPGRVPSVTDHEPKITPNPEILRSEISSRLKRNAKWSVLKCSKYCKTCYKAEEAIAQCNDTWVNKHWLTPLAMRTIGCHDSKCNSNREEDFWNPSMGEMSWQFRFWSNQDIHACTYLEVLLYSKHLASR